MNRSAFLSKSDSQLAGMLATDLPEAWSEADLVAMLVQQLALLAAQVFADEGLLDPAVAKALAALKADATLRDLLVHPSPPKQALEAARLWGKALRQDAVPAVMAVRRVVYFVAIAAGKHRLKTWTTQLDESKVQEGWAWVLSCGWVDELIKSVVRAASGDTR